ncbi:SEC10/PgrA surface exclusion domain-containing protein [Lactiplantibacillus paraxiangfangensis]|uniref:SEC10/PgrA surface exclusion domain-containing protein n=1 Tax=Lactiplantibacillus paraxiangfangensis TaxID=3076224 RepID=UPI0030C72EB1
MGKNGNKLVIATTTAAATLVIIGGNNTLNARADTVPSADAPTTTTATSLSVTDAKQNVKTAQQTATQTQSELAAAKAKANSSKSKSDDSQKAVVAAKETLDQAKNTESTAQQTADQATPDAINQAQADVQQQNTTTNKVAQQVQTDQSKVTDAQQTTNQAKTNVVTAQKNLADTDATVKDAQAKADAAKKVADNVGLDAAQQKLADAKQQQTQANQQANTAQSNATQADQTATDAANQVKTAQANTDSANTALNAAQKSVIDANNNVTDAQNMLNAAKSQLGDSAVPLSADYFKTIKDYYESQSADLTLRKRLTDIGADMFNHLPKFVPSAADEKTLINGESDLTPEIRTEIAVYTAALVNKLRVAAGLPTVFVTKGMINFADDVAKNYEADNWDFTADGHDANAINKAAKANGLPEHPGVNLYEDAGSDYGSIANLQGDIETNWQTNLGKIKSGLYYAVYKLLLDDDLSNWGHAYSLLGLREMGLSQDSGFHNMLGTSLSVRQFGSNPKNGDKYVAFDIHFLQALDGSAMGSPLFDTTVVPSPKVGTTQSDVNALSADLATKQAAAKAANAALTTATQKVAAASQTLKTAKANLTTAQQKQATAKTALTTAQAAVKSVTDTVTAAQQKVDDYNASPEVKQQALKTAQSVLTQAKQNQADKQVALNKAQTNLTAANQQLASAKATLANDQQALMVAQTTLATKQATLASLQNAKPALADAKIAVQQAQAEYDKLVQQANEDRQNATVDDAAYQALLARVTDAKSKLTTAKAQLTRLQRAAKINATLDGVDGDDVVTLTTPDAQATVTEEMAAGDHAQTVQPAQAKLSTPVATQKKVPTNASALPQTGERHNQQAAWGAVLALTLGVLGLAGLKRKRGQNF